eukprot:IDg1337t1
MQFVRLSIKFPAPSIQITREIARLPTTLALLFYRSCGSNDADGARRNRWQRRASVSACQTDFHVALVCRWLGAHDNGTPSADTRTATLHGAHDICSTVQSSAVEMLHDRAVRHASISRASACSKLQHERA